MFHVSEFGDAAAHSIVLVAAAIVFCRLTHAHAMPFKACFYAGAEAPFVQFKFASHRATQRWQLANDMSAR